MCERTSGLTGRELNNKQAVPVPSDGPGNRSKHGMHQAVPACGLVGG